MATVLGGGNFTCPHGLDTSDVNEINEHCLDPANGHTLSGATQCIDCNVEIKYQNLPFKKITAEGFGIKMRCPSCFQKYISEQEQFITPALNEGDGQ